MKKKVILVLLVIVALLTPLGNVEEPTPEGNEGIPIFYESPLNK